MKRLRLRIVMGVAALIVAAAPAQAQQDDRRLALTRDALRQAQQALQAAENQRATLDREKQALVAERDALKATLDKRNTADSVELARQGQELQSLRAQSTTLRDEAVTQAKAAEQLNTERQDLRTRLAQAEIAARERQQLNERLAALLAQSTQALAAAEAQNDQLVAAGEQIIEAYRGKTAGESNAQFEPLFGLARVRVEARAEALRRQLDDSRRAVAPK